MGSQENLDSLLKDLTSAASSTSVANGAVIAHILSTNSGKFRKKDFGQTVDALYLLLAQNSPGTQSIRLKCKDIYGKYTALKKHFSNEAGWKKLKEYLLLDFFKVAQVSAETLLDHPYSASTRQTPATPKRATAAAPETVSPKKLKSDCLKCVTNRHSLTSTATKLAEQKSISHKLKREVAGVKRDYNKKTVDQRRRRNKERIRDLVHENKNLKKRLAALEAHALNQAKRKRKARRDKDNLDKQQLELEERVRKLSAEVKELQSERLFLHNLLAESEKGLQETKIIEVREGKSYIPAVRQAVYFMLCSQVPVEACGPILQEVVTTISHGAQRLSSVPSPSTSAQMAYELSIISCLQVATLLMEESNICLSWDATSVDGSHVNEIHLTTGSTCLTLNVKRIVGGKAEDYSNHILTAFTSIAALYCKFHKTSDESHMLARLYRAVTCTLTDRAPVNSAAVSLLRKHINSQLVELHCNMHPLDAFAKRSKEELEKLDREHLVVGRCYGREGCAANLIQGVSKLRYKASSGDPEGFKSFLRDHMLSLGTILRYVGNRLHVLMHSAGILLHHREIITTFLRTKCTASSLRLAVLADMDNIQIIDQVWALAVVGKFVSGPWMQRFYTSEGRNIDMVPILQSSKNRLLQWHMNVADILTAPHLDVFGSPLAEDPVLTTILSQPFSELKTRALKSIVGGVLKVYSTQLSEYTHGSLAQLSQQQKQQVSNAPMHNMQSERALALLDGIWRRAPNATPGFLNGKVQCKLNKTLQWLDTQSPTLKKEIILFSITEGKKARKEAIEEDKLLNKAVSERREVAQKRDKSKRSQLSRKIQKLLEEKSGGGSSDDLSEDVVALLAKYKEEPQMFRGLCFRHVWEEEDGTEKQYKGRIRDLKVQTKSSKQKFKVSYWGPDEQESASEDYLITVAEFFADMTLGDLITC